MVSGFPLGPPFCYVGDSGESILNATVSDIENMLDKYGELPFSHQKVFDSLHRYEIMSNGSGITSFRYAFNSELLKLYSLIVLGLTIVRFSRTGLGLIENFSTLPPMFTLPLYGAGITLVVGGNVGVLHRIVSDSLN